MSKKLEDFEKIVAFSEYLNVTTMSATSEWNCPKLVLSLLFTK